MKVSKGTKLFILGAVLVVIDQIIKVLVKTNMELGESIDVIGDWFKLNFVLNKGMAFGMAFGGLWGKVLLSMFRIILFGFLCWWISGLAKKKDTPTGVLVGLTLITAGALGNIVDCLFYGMIWPETICRELRLHLCSVRWWICSISPCLTISCPGWSILVHSSELSLTLPTAVSLVVPSICCCSNTSSFQKNNEI